MWSGRKGQVDRAPGRQQLQILGQSDPHRTSPKVSVFWPILTHSWVCKPQLGSGREKAALYQQKRGLQNPEKCQVLGQ